MIDRTFRKQKGALSVRYFRIAGFILLIALSLLSFTRCSIFTPDQADTRSAKVKKRIDKKHQKKYEKAREKFVENHYERQPENAKKWMDYNASQNKQWREEYYDHGPGVFERIGDWFERIIEWFNQPEEGLYGQGLKDHEKPGHLRGRPFCNNYPLTKQAWKI